MDDFDVGLLFKSLVLINEDLRSVTEDKTSLETVTEVTIAEAQNSPETALPSSENAAIQIPGRIILTNLKVKAEIEAPNSNFNKIISALKITNTGIFCIEDTAVSALSQCSHIWCVGLSEAEQMPLLALPPQIRLLQSPNMERLSNNEEKRAMFEPLKQFVSSWEQ